MRIISLDHAKLWLNRETVSPLEQGSIDMLIDSIQSMIEGEVGYSFEDLPEIPCGLPYVAAILLVSGFRAISEQRIGVKSEQFGNLYIRYQETGSLPPFLDLLLQRHRACPVG